MDATLFHVAPEVIWCTVSHDPRSGRWAVRVAVSERQPDGVLQARETDLYEGLTHAEALDVVDAALLVLLIGSSSSSSSD